MEYNNSNHSVINNSPKKRFIKDENRIKYALTEDLEYHFRHSEEHKVLNDSTIKIKIITFEVTQRYICQKIKIQFYPGDLSNAYIFDKEDQMEIFPLRRVDNLKVKRNNK